MANRREDTEGLAGKLAAQEGWVLRLTVAQMVARHPASQAWKEDVRVYWKCKAGVPRTQRRNSPQPMVGEKGSR